MCERTVSLLMLIAGISAAAAPVLRSPLQKGEGLGVRFRRRGRAAFALIASSLLAGCAPTYAPHIDAPPTSILAPLDAPPHLPDADQSPCPARSGLAACFTHDEDVIRQDRFKLLHDDRDYCRNAYARAVTRSSAAQ